MKNKIVAKSELISMILGMLMFLGGVLYFLTKVRVSSSFFSSHEGWPLWASFLCLVPLITGIVLMLIKPRKWYPRLVGIGGGIFLIIMIAQQTTLHMKTRLASHQWLITGVLVLGGLLIVFITLFAKKKDKNEKR